MNLGVLPPHRVKTRSLTSMELKRSSPTLVQPFDTQIACLFDPLRPAVVCEPTKSRWGQRTVTSGRWLNGLGVERRDRQLAAAAVSAGLACITGKPPAGSPAYPHLVALPPGRGRQHQCGARAPKISDVRRTAGSQAGLWL